jgi:hypothetical protein
MTDQPDAPKPLTVEEAARKAAKEIREAAEEDVVELSCYLNRDDALAFRCKMDAKYIATILRHIVPVVEALEKAADANFWFGEAQTKDLKIADLEAEVEELQRGIDVVDADRLKATEEVERLTERKKRLSRRVGELAAENYRLTKRA